MTLPGPSPPDELAPPLPRYNLTRMPRATILVVDDE